MSDKYLNIMKVNVCNEVNAKLWAGIEKCETMDELIVACRLLNVDIERLEKRILNTSYVGKDVTGLRVIYYK